MDLKLVTLTYKQLDILNNATPIIINHENCWFGLRFIKHLPSSQRGGGFLYKVIDEKQWVYTRLHLDI